MIVFIWRLVGVIRGRMVWTTLDLRGERREERCEICLKLRVNLANYPPLLPRPARHIQIQIHPSLSLSLSLKPAVSGLVGGAEFCLISN